MFRIESYITSIILSYVDRYIKNFRQQDAQVSLWEGDGSFQNLNLDLEVLEQELNLPFSFVSGHIHELLIHVPWTRLISEPVKITINTIECVMKLKPVGSHHSQSKVARRGPRAVEDPQSQSSLMSSLVNKIICNLSVTCNNLILKYVEEDIVLSMNIKTLSIGTVNNNWEPSFIEMSATQLELRKLISLSDVTICLDKRNASGRIESYLEPLLYRCFMTVRLWQSYPSMMAKRPASTRIDILCEQMAFTVSEPQLPMIMRLMALCLALQRKQLSQTSLVQPADDSSTDKSDEDVAVGQINEEAESWSSWAFSWMPTLIPLSDDIRLDSNPYQDFPANTIFNFGFYIDTFTLALKLCESDGTGGVKTQSQAFMHILFKGCRMDLLSHNTDWTNVQMGISQATVKPDGDCCCGVSESSQLVYLSSGAMHEEFISGSLFHKSPSELEDRLGHSWKYHLESVSETIMLEKTPAFAVDYLSCVQDKADDEESDDEDGERLPPKEKVVIRYVAGPVVVRVCSGLIHRIQMLKKACSTYDYVPYTTNTALPVVQDNQVMDLVHRLSEKSIEMDEDLYSRYLPLHTAQFTAFNTTIELYPATHLPVHFSSLGRKLSRTQRKVINSGSNVSPILPCVIVEWKCVYATLTRPLYPDKILLMASKFHKDKMPIEITNTSLTRLAFKAVGVLSSVRLPFHQAMKVVEMSSVTSEQTWHSLITPLEDTVSSDIGLHIANITITSSKAKLVLLYETVSSLIATNNRQHYLASFKTIFNTSLLQDAATTTDTIYLKLSIEQLKMRRVLTELSGTTFVSIMACHLFALQLTDKEWETMIVSAPDTPVETPLLEAMYQEPSSLNVFPPLLVFKLQEVRFSADPLLYSWLLYTPTSAVPSHPPVLKSHKSTESIKSRKVSDSSLSSYIRRAPTPQESIHSSSGRETTPSGHPSSHLLGENVQTVPIVPFPDRVASWYPIWKAMIVYGDIHQVSIYLPHTSLALPKPHSMEEGLTLALSQQSSQVAVIKLPAVTLRCTNYRQNVPEFTNQLPVKLPPHLWTPEKDNFPWLVTISDLHCFTLNGSVRIPLLKPVSFNCTIGTSPKFTERQMLSSLALCVHLDTTPVNIKVSEEQVVLIVNLLMAQLKVMNVLMPVWASETTIINDTSSVKLISSDESSNVTQSDDLGRGGGPVKVKLTGWLQWTLARTTVSVYNKLSRGSHNELKLTLDVEDVIMSLDVENVYHKVKLKVATASVCHYVRSSSKESWKRGAFHGLVMRGYDPDGLTMKHSSDESQARAGFIMATVTRAKCNNLHSRLGSPSKNPALTKKSVKNDKFITEIEVKMQPLDFVLSPTTLNVFIRVLDPLLCLSQPLPSSGAKATISYHSSSLPLLYLDLMTIRVVLPTLRQKLTKHQPDVLIIQFDGMTANPHPENPICRTPLRPDIYHKGEKQQTLNIPGSDLEDRQYQFNLTNLRVQTGMWHELEDIFVREVAESSQQNPALDWNEGRSPMFQVPASQLMHPLINSFNLSLVLAPAMVYQDKDVVCGHACEINAVSDIGLMVTLDQLFLCGLLTSEMLSALYSVPQRQAVLKGDGSVSHPRNQGLQHSLSEHDSGIESIGSSSTHTKPVDPNIPGVHAVSSSGISQISGFVHSSVPSSIYPTPLVWPSKRSVIPCEVLITGSALILSVFSVEYSDQPVYEPLLHAHLSQPHAFLCKNSDSQLSCQISAFDLNVSCGIKGHTVSKQVTSKPFPQPLLETRHGEPHAFTGIPPALFTLKMNWSNDKPPKIDIDLGRPIRMICKLEVVDYLKNLQNLIHHSFVIPCTSIPVLTSQKVIDVSAHKRDMSQSHASSSDHSLRKVWGRFSLFTLKTQQLLLNVHSSLEDEVEMSLSIAKFSSEVNSNLSLQQAVTGIFSLDGITLSTHKVRSAKLRLVINPWQLTIKTALSWDSWLTTADSPLVNISVYSDIFSLQLSPEQLNCLMTIWTTYAPLYSSSDPVAEKPVPSQSSSIGSSSIEEQQYNDDLQAGAFQFVDSNGRREDLPLTYQVVFWSGQTNTPTMSWRYPQPRTITKFCVLPIPFRDVGGEDVPVERSCVLQYYSESQASYQDHVGFTISETDSQLVELPQSLPRVVATVWRVVLGHDAAQVTPVKALAASIRVDSYFSPALVPTLKLAVNLTAVEVSLWTLTDSFLPLPSPLDRYYLDKRFPEEHDFLKLVLEQANVTFLVWPKVSQQVIVKGRARLDILDYCTLSYQCCVPPFPLVAANYWTAECRQCSLVVGHITMRVGPTISHSLVSSLSPWTQSLCDTDQPSHQPVLTPYVVCNNTYLPIRFRQAGSDEFIPLQCFQCHLYSWRTTKHPMELEFGLLEPEDNDWSKSIPLRPNTNAVIKLHAAARELDLLVSVQRFSPTVCQVVINGQLALHNNLSVPLEVRVMPECGEQCSLVVQSGTSPPTVIVDPRYNISLKVRFSSIPSTTQSLWSGEIPLRHNGKDSPSNMQWEVKLPLKERGQFQSVWCHVVWNLVENVSQMLVVLSPLYMIKSLLPCQTNVLIETPALSSSQMISIAGRGAVQQLDTPGLSDETHNLTFQLDNKVPASSPPVSLHYHMMDDSPCPDPAETNINNLLNSLQRQTYSSEWPYLGRDWATVDWIVTTQPDTVTQVKVRFSNNCVATNMLLVEVQPWALLVNTLGTYVYLQGKERTLCSLANRSVISPPPLESTFQIGVELEGSVQLSNPIQLKRGPGFEMPYIPGLLSPSGFINTSITHKDTVCWINITSSEEVNSLRLIHVRSTYVIASLSKRDLTVAALAVEPSTTKHSLPDDIMRSSVMIKSLSKPGKPKLRPLTEWRVLAPGDSLLPHLVVEAGGAVSCPVQIPAGTDRSSVNVLFPAAPEDSLQEMLVMTTEQRDGQVQILLWDQPCPQITIHNHTNSIIYFAKAKAEASGFEIESDCDHIEWLLKMEAGTKAHYSFPAVVGGPDIVQPNILPTARIGVATKSPNGIKWSDCINLTHCSGRLLTLLGLPDLSMSVSKRGFTTHIILTQASHTEILAVDIRGQLTRQLLAESQNVQSRRNLVEEKQTQEKIEDPTTEISTHPGENRKDDTRGLDFSCFVHGLTATLLTQSEQGTENREVAALTLDQLAVTLDPHPHQDSCVRELKIHTTISDMQLDNQEFSAGGYDFPVVMLMQKSSAAKSVDITMNQHARGLAKEARSKGSAADVTVVVDTNSHNTIAVQDINVKLLPLQIYIEDKYVYHLKDCLINTLPSSLFSETPSTSKSNNQNNSTVHKNNIELNTKQNDSQKPIENELIERDILEESNAKKDLSECAEEEDLFNVSEPDMENMIPEEIAMPNTDLTVVCNATPTYESESIWSVSSTAICHQSKSDPVVVVEGFPIATDIISASRDLARPLRLRSLNISELNLLVSIHTSTRFYIALDHSPLQLAAFKRSSLFTTAYRLGHSLTLHYFFGAIYGTGWALGSLELLGAPGGLARSLGLGLRDFINLPLQGILVGPRAFFTGIAHGSASLMQHFAAGTITSVTRLAASWARTLDRLTLDCQDLERSEQMRRLRPQNLTQGVVQGLTEFGISLIGAISSIAHHPLQYVMSQEPDRSLVNSIGLGLVGVITRPLSGVAELVALTGEGLLSGVGWTDSRRVRQEPAPIQNQSGTDSRLKYKWKLLLPGEQLLLITDATTDCYEAVTLLVTSNSLYVVNSELDIVVRAIKLSDLQSDRDSSDPTLVVFRILPAREQAHLLSQSRIMEYVRESQRVLAGELSNISPPPTPPVDLDENPQLEFYINPQVRNHFLSVLNFATNHAVGRGFPVIS